MPMALQIRPLSPQIGVEISGLDLSRPPDEATRQALWEAFIDAGLLAFRGVGTSAAAHVALSRCFGDLQRHPVRENWVENQPELVDISHRPGPNARSTVALYEVEGERRGGWLPWHSDLRYMARINRGGVLRCLTPAPTAGRTGFIDQIRAYETLSEELKRRIEGLWIVYRLRPDFTRERFGRPAGLRLVANAPALEAMAARLDRDFPPVLHPLVYVQAETGRRVLNLSPTSCDGIFAMDPQEGDSLLETLVAHLLDPANAYFFDWHRNDMVLWDNWRTLHCAEGVPEHCTREMQRTTILGDYALGRPMNIEEEQS
jgi:taurine dioxygenase